MSFLRALPVHTLKIDRSCVGEVQSNPEFAAAFVNMARTIDLEVIHEGVETVEQLGFFRSIACEELQGYLFCKPLPAEEVVQVLDKAVIATMLMGAGDGALGAGP
jgi:EAL domain-containing protein (putative c-di-GMP-specific phosphodiesterase class I)